MDLCEGFKCFHEHPKLDAETPRFTAEERVLHSLHERGLDIDSLDSYIKEDVERLSTKLGVVHERMKSHLSDLLRPALDQTAGADGAGAFNDGSDQFASGDFADEMGDDFFGFKELGLADELGLETLSVPFHLLQNRMHNAYQSQHQGPVSSTGLVFEPPAAYDPITVENLPLLVGPAQDFFRRKLSANRDEPLVEDEDLPQKQRFPKPRLPPTGKISSPRKRPIREQQQAAKKKRKLDEDEREARLFSKPVGPLRLQMPESQWTDVDPEKDGEANGAMISPESLNAN
nr:transcriptional activator spt7 [Quercus suber]